MNEHCRYFPGLLPAGVAEQVEARWLYWVLPVWHTAKVLLNVTNPNPKDPFLHLSVNQRLF